MKILIADDEKVLVDNLIRLIETAVFPGKELELITVPNGKQALEQIALQDDFDIVISDFDMPHANGLEVLKNLRTKNAGTSFILMTGTLLSDEQLDYLASLNGKLLEKPYSFDELILSLR